MQNATSNATISCFLLKVASRCNINCDYCYMYNHLDQSYKSQPKLMSVAVMDQAAKRIVEYVVEKNIQRIAIVYHGGEPLLMHRARFAHHIQQLRSLMPLTVDIEFSMQTNGVLLQECDIKLFESLGLQVSVSLDGPESANNRHRLDHQGKSSFHASLEALKMLQQYPKVFSGVIAVIDPRNDPQQLLDFFASYDIPQLDFLLPDANFLTLPPLKNKDNAIFENWLIRCFDIWFDQFPSLKIRTFDSILASLMGVPSETDGFGFGDVSLITIETDGSYHDLDVLKITGDGTHLDNGDVFSSPIAQAALSKQVEEHRKLLKKEGLAKACLECEVVEICGGGAVAHRYGENGYDNPSIYCSELKRLIQHIAFRVSEEIEKENQYISGSVNKQLISDYELDALTSGALKDIRESFQQHQAKILTEMIKAASLGNITALENGDLRLAKVAVMPSVVVWTEVMEKNRSGQLMQSIDGNIVDGDPDYLQSFLDQGIDQLNWPLINRSDPWLRYPFGKEIYFEDEITTKKAFGFYQKLRT